MSPKNVVTTLVLFAALLNGIACAEELTSSSSSPNDTPVITRAPGTDLWTAIPSSFRTMNMVTGEELFIYGLKSDEPKNIVLFDLKKKTIAPWRQLPPAQELETYQIPFPTANRKEFLYVVQRTLPQGALPDGREVFASTPTMKSTRMAHRSTLYVASSDGYSPPVALTPEAGDFASWVYDPVDNVAYCTVAMNRKTGVARVDVTKRTVTYFNMEPFDPQKKAMRFGNALTRRSFGGSDVTLRGLFADKSLLMVDESVGPNPFPRLPNGLMRYDLKGNAYAVNPIELPMVDPKKRRFLRDAVPSAMDVGLFVQVRSQRGPVGSDNDPQEIWFCKDLRIPKWAKIYEAPNLMLIGADPSGSALWMAAEVMNGNSRTGYTHGKLDLETMKYSTVWNEQDHGKLWERLLKQDDANRK